MDQLTVLHEAEQISATNSKADIVTMCRNLGWSGDPERFNISATDRDGSETTYGGKMALAIWLAKNKNNSTAKEPQQFTLEPTSPAPAARQHVQNGDKAARIAELLAELTATPKAEPLDPEQVRAIVAEEVAKQAPRYLEVKTEFTSAKLDGQQHPLFEKVLRLVASGVNVMLTGPAGSGKTHMAEQVAKALNREYGAIHCTAGASESQLFGWLLPTGEGGRFEYQPAPFVRLYEGGNSLFLFDEIDAADPNFLLAANSSLANGHVHVPMRTSSPEVARGDSVAIMATANTFGTGSDMVYAGRNQLDGATLDRFYMVSVSYMETLEASMMGLHKTSPKAWEPASMEEADIAKDLAALYGWLCGIRSAVNEQKLRRVVSTRAFQKAAAARRAGVPVAEIKIDLLAGWTQDELRKVGA